MSNKLWYQFNKNIPKTQIKNPPCSISRVPVKCGFPVFLYLISWEPLAIPWHTGLTCLLNNSTAAGCQQLHVFDFLPGGGGLGVQDCGPGSALLLHEDTEATPGASAVILTDLAASQVAHTRIHIYR